MAAPVESGRVAPQVRLVADGGLGVQLAGALTTARLSHALCAPGQMSRPVAENEVILLGIRAADELDRLTDLRAAVPDAPIVVVIADDPEGLVHDHVLAAGAEDCLAAADAHGALLGHVLRRSAAFARLRRAQRIELASLRALFDASPDPAWVCALPTRRLLMANRAAMEACGYAADAWCNMHLDDLRVATTDLAPQRPGAGVIERLRRDDGSEFEAEVRSWPLQFEGRDALLVQARDPGPWRRVMQDLDSAERRVRALFEYAVGYACIHDLDGTLLEVNRAAAAAIDATPAALQGRPLRDILARPLRARFDDYLARIRRQHEDAGQLQLRRRDGSERVWQYRSRLFHEADGSARVVCHAQDITAQRAAERALASGEHRLRTIADALPVRIAYVDLRERVLFANEACRHAWPVVAERPRASLRSVIGAQRYAHYRPYLQRAFAGERVVFEYSEGVDESFRCFELTFVPETAEGRPRVVGVHVMAQDITATKREQQRLQRLARMDALSGVLNRAGFMERFDNALARARDQDAMLALLYLDIDQFKRINDQHGHAAGDALIHAFAQRLARQVRSSDLVARLGGDEFAVVIEGLPDARRIDVVAASLVQAFGQPFVLGDGVCVTVGVSIGIALCRGAPLTAERMLARADAELYSAKRAGRGTWRMARIDGASPAPG